MTQGLNKRVWNHFISNESFETITEDETKGNKINVLKNLGYEKIDIARVLAKNLTEDEAFLLESFLIKTIYGYENLTNRVHGKHKHRFRQFNSLESFNYYDEFLVGRLKIRQSREGLVKEFISRPANKSQ